MCLRRAVQYLRLSGASNAFVNIQLWTCMGIIQRVRRTASLLLPKAEKYLKVNCLKLPRFEGRLAFLQPAVLFLTKACDQEVVSLAYSGQAKDSQASSSQPKLRQRDANSAPRCGRNLKHDHPVDIHLLPHTRTCSTS